MSNHAKVKKNDFVFDPFVGTGENLLFYFCTHVHGSLGNVSVNTFTFLALCVSGSLLIACSQFGAYVCGADIDYNTIHGKGWLASTLILFGLVFLNHLFLCLSGRSSRKNQKWRGPDENIRANLRQYGTENLYLDVMVSDASKSVWRKAAVFDAIITDRRWWMWRLVTRVLVLLWRGYSFQLHMASVSPQGEQAPIKTILKLPMGRKFTFCSIQTFVARFLFTPFVFLKKCLKTHFFLPSFVESHVPVSQAYNLSDIFTDLLNFSAHHLVLGGRLVYWLPIYRPEWVP